MLCSLYEQDNSCSCMFVFFNHIRNFLKNVCDFTDRIAKKNDRKWYAIVCSYFGTRIRPFDENFLHNDNTTLNNPQYLSQSVFENFLFSNLRFQTKELTACYGRFL